MKAIMVIIDGLADEKIEALGFQTSFNYAQHPNLERLAAQGITFHIDTCPKGYLPESMPCILNLLGITSEHFPKSRASLELLANGYTLNSDEVVWRCNLVAIDDKKRLSSFNGGHLNQEQMQEASRLVAHLEPRIEFVHQSGYRNLIIMNKSYLQRIGSSTYPPHEYLGDNIDDLLADTLNSSEALQRFFEASTEKLKVMQDEKYQYLLYPWGIAEKNILPSLQELYKTKGAAVCGAEIAKGIALALDMFVPKLDGLTADTDTNLILKAQTACKLLDEYEFVLVHINGADEASHRCNVSEKIKFIERIDQEFFGYLLNNLDHEIRILVCADHATSPVLGKHLQMDVPIILRKEDLTDLKNHIQQDKNDILDSKNDSPDSKSGIPNFKNDILDFKKDIPDCGYDSTSILKYLLRKESAGEITWPR